MENKIYLERQIAKINKLVDAYTPYIYENKREVSATIYQTTEFYTKCPKNVEFKAIKIGDEWGEEFSYAWFKLDKITNSALAKTQTYLYDANGAVENLVFFNDLPVGMTDNVIGQLDVGARLHEAVKIPPLSPCDSLEITMEGYASHTFCGTQPYEKKQTFAMRNYSQKRVFNGVFLVEKNEVVDNFVDNLKSLRSLYNANIGDLNKAKLQNLYEAITPYLDFMPNEQFDLNSLKKASETIQSTIFNGENKTLGEVGLIGHSHLDTAWLWRVSETKRKLARTVANALAKLDEFDDYTFCISSVLYIDWLKNDYPSLFARVKEYVKKGRFEIVGGAYVECDCNLVGGESLVRQFLLGQNFLMDNFGITNDNFFLPDTFGYSASLPQILNQVGITKFVTTKLSWNDLNKFPYDTFMWNGIDRSRVLTHFGTMHNFPNAELAINSVQSLPNKHLSTKKLVTYGYGDGGGGPNDKMVASAIKLDDTNYTPKCKHVLVSKFLDEFDKDTLPNYFGELYLELHRGTLTTNGLLKRQNRKLEIALHNFELLKVGVNSQFTENVDAEYKTMLINQFHDILPGTCIKSVNDIAHKENDDALNSINAKTQALLKRNGDKIVAYNVLPFEYVGNIEIESESGFERVDGKKAKIIEGVTILPYSSVEITDRQSETANFTYQNDRLETKFYSILFNDNMEIASLFDKDEQRELSRGVIGRYVLFDDVPYMWDNWDIDYGYENCKTQTAKLINKQVINSATNEFRIRCDYQIGNSHLTHDLVFSSQTKLIDFQVKVDYKDKHKLLKVGFETTLFVDEMRNEIQFGHITRKTVQNNSYDIAQYEVSNQKWTDISEQNFGLTLLNDCKYGLSAKQGDLWLSLIKSGTHPDETADNYTHFFNFALAPHRGGFSAKNTIIPAYTYNYTPQIAVGGAPFHLPFITDKDNIIIETIKESEVKDGVIIRLYESEKSHTICHLQVGNCKTASLTNLLETPIKVLEVANNQLTLTFKPFEIKTIKLTR